MFTLNLPDIERAVEYAQYVLACSDQSPATFVKSSTGSSNKSKSIHQKLMDLYIEETMKQPENKDVVYASNLLAKLMKRERLNCMVLSLYPGNEGYSIMLKSRSGVESETMKLPYEESDILEFIDAAQLPPFLLDLLEKAQMNVFYSGCVIVEIRDYRRSATGSHDSQYVLLKPSPQSLLRDVTAMSCDGHTWSQDDLFHLESELILATEEPLCLDPSPAVMLVENALQYEDKFLNDPALKRSVKRYTQAAMNRKRKLAQATAPQNMRLHDFLVKKREKSKTTPTAGLAKARTLIDGFKYKTESQLTTPESIDVKKYSKIPEIPSSNGAIFVEEHTLEREPNLDRHMMAKITIYLPQLGDSYFGEFYLDYDYSPGKTGEEGRRCRFPIGSRQCVDRYLQQFRDLFTEEGKLHVKIAIQKGNEPKPTVYYTPAMPQEQQGAATNTNITALSISNAQALMKQVTPLQATPSTGPTAITINSAQALMKQVQQQQQTLKGTDMGTVASLAAKRNIPIQLSLSISPAASLSSSQASAGILAQAPITSLPTTVSAQFLASAIPAASVVPTHRIKTAASMSTQHRPSSSPLASPAAPPKVSTPQQSNLTSGTQIIAIPKAPTPTPAQTPPPNCRTPTPTSAGSRRSSATDLNQQAGSSQQTLQHNNIASFIQGLTSGANSATSESQSAGQSSQQQSGLANISISSLSSLPPNINIQGLTGLPGVNITNLSGLQQMQVSLAQIAVPVPITMINTNSSLLQGQTGLLANASSTSGSNAATLVTMVTALPASSSSTATSTSASVSSQVAMSTGPSSNAATVLPQGSGILSLPMGLSGLTQIMPVSSKGQGGHTIRGASGMPLLQLQGQQSIQLLSLQQRGQVKSASISGSSGQQGISRLAQGATSTVPLSTVLSNQQMTALAVGGKTGQGGGAPITAQQLIQLTGASSNPLGQGPSQLATHVAFQKNQGSGPQQTLQFHSLQLKPGGVTLTQTAGTAGKGKSKKRTSTPPK